MRFAVQHAFDGRIITKLEGALAVVAAEAGAVVGAAVGGELLDRVDRLAARGALLLGAAPRRRHTLLPVVGQRLRPAAAMAQVVVLEWKDRGGRRGEAGRKGKARMGGGRDD